MEWQFYYQNPLMYTDSYNISHAFLGIKADVNSDNVMHIYNRNAPMILFGFNHILNKILNVRIADKMVEEIKQAATNTDLEHWFDYNTWITIIDNFDGIIPIKVYVLPEFSFVPKNTPFCQIYCTGIERPSDIMAWFEGMILHAYFPSTCLTNMYINYYEHRNYIHNFGFRGARSLEDAFWSDLAWSLLCGSSDSIHIWNALDNPEKVKITTIPALAHKVVQQYRVDIDNHHNQNTNNERNIDHYNHYLTEEITTNNADDHKFENSEMTCHLNAIKSAKKNKSKSISLLIDTNSIDRYINRIMPQIIEMGEKLDVLPIFRLDSGNMIEDIKKIFKLYGKRKYKLLLGDSIGSDYINKINSNEFGEIPPELEKKLVFGIGGKFYEEISRETLGWSMKLALFNNIPTMKFASGKLSYPGLLKITENEKENLFCIDLANGLEDLGEYVLAWSKEKFNENYRKKKYYVDNLKTLDKIANFNTKDHNLQKRLIVGKKLDQLITKLKSQIE